MARFIIDKNTFLQGISNNPEFGMENMYGVDIYREYGYMAGGWKSVDATSGTISSTISWFVPDNSENLLADSLMWVVGNGKVGKYNINHGFFSETTTGANYGGGGAATLKDVLYVGGDGSSDNIGKLHIAGGNLGGWTAGWKATKQTDYKEMIRMKDEIYGCNKDSIFSISDSATFDGSALILETNTTAVSLAPYGEYLAIGAIKGRYFPSNAGGYGLGAWQSKLYFWDTISSSWDTDRSTNISGRVLKVINKKGILYVFVKDRPDSISINYFDGNALQLVKRVTPKEGSDITLPSNGAYDIKEDLIYFGLAEASSDSKYTPMVYAYGKGYFDSPIALSNPFVHPSLAPSTIGSIDALKWAKDNELFMSITDTGSVQTFKVFKPANNFYYFNVKTPNLYTGIKQMCQRIKLNFKPLATNDKIYLYRNIDNAGFESSVWDSCSYGGNGAISTYSITRNFEFNNLQLRADGNITSGGNIRLKNIIVDSEDIDEV